LPQNSIFAVTQTPDGYIWLASDTGLARFDGVKFDIFSQENVPALKGNLFHGLLVDRDGTLWISSWEGGLMRYKNGTFEKVFTRSNGLSSDNVRHVLLAADGSMWVGTINGVNRLVHMSGSRIAVTSIPLPAAAPSHKINAVAEGPDGTIWLGSDNGLLAIAKEGGKYVAKQAGLGKHQVTTLTVDRQGLLWVGTNGSGLFRMPGEKKEEPRLHFTPGNGLASDLISVLYTAADGSVWVGTRSGGLNRIQYPAIYSFDVSKGLSHNYITSIFKDREGNLWVGTNGKGVNLFSESRITVYSKKNGLSHDQVFGVYRDNRDNIWVGTFGSGVDCIKDGKIVKHYSEEDGLPSNLVLTISQDQTGSLWFGTYGGGVARLKNGRFETFSTRRGLVSNIVYGLFTDSKGQLWAGTNKGGLHRFENGRFSLFTRIKEKVRAFMEDRSGSLWVGTDITGVVRITGNTFEIFDESRGLSSNDVLAILEDKSGAVWVSTFGGGVNRYNRTGGGFQSVTRKDGLPHDVVFWMLEDNNGYLWMTTMEGIFRVGRKELEDFFKGLVPSVNCTLFDESSGMKVRECNGGTQPSGVEDAEGNLWFITADGAAVFDPARMIDVSISPAVAIKHASIDGRDYLPKQEWHAPPGKGNLEFYYAGFHFAAPDRLEFQYRLDGYDEDWVEAGKRRAAYYTNISPGSYRFRVRARLEGGAWGETGASLPLLLQPHFWQTWWFYLLLVLSGLFLIRFFYFLKLKNVQRRQRKLEKLVAERTRSLKNKTLELEVEREAAQAANRAKSMFLARMSHEIRTPMNSVIGFADILKNTPLNDEQQEFIGNITKSGEALLHLIDEILDFSKIEAGQLIIKHIDFDPEVLAFDVCHSMQPRLENKPIEILCRIGDQVPAFVRSDAARIRQVLVNLLGNAVKFTHEGEIELSLQVDEETPEQLKLHFAIRDTGIGISPESLDTVFEVFRQGDNSDTRQFGGTGLGLAISRQIARLLEGDIRVESKLDEGSTFHFTAWVQKSHKQPVSSFSNHGLIGKKILLAADSPNRRDILLHIVWRVGMIPETVDRGNRVISIIEEAVQKGEPFDICIFDMHMLGMSSADAVSQIRGHDNPRVAQLPLLGLTLPGDPTSERQAEKLLDGLLPKPIRGQKLLTMIQRLLQAPVGEADSAAEPETSRQELVTQHSLAEEAKQSVYILLVEDNPINRKLAHYMLTRGGYRLDMAHNGKEAVAMFTANPDRYHLVFMDVNMPEMDGRQATRTIQEKGFTGVPIIAMTAHALKEDRERCLEAGMNDYIAKPIKRDIVFNMIKKWLLERP
jgi:signal transduction histidine kinase/ligand-binding sensor domain-containing protein/CheY-like chemotaxis protein